MELLIVTTTIQVAAGLGLPALLALLWSRRARAPHGLITVGLLVGLVVELLALLVQYLFGGRVALALAPSVESSLVTPVFAGVVGLLTGLITVGAVAFGLAYLARQARSWPHILMMGLGFGSANLVLRSALTALTLAANLAVRGDPALPPEELAALSAYFARSPLEPLLLPITGFMNLVFGLAVTALVGRVFLTGEVGYFFAALLWSAITATAALLFAPGGISTQTGVWLVIGAVSLVIAWQAARDDG